MKHLYSLTGGIILLFALYSFTTHQITTPNQENCKVQLDKISGSYEGECKKGFAHGKGIAKGEDYYEGEFKKGYPHGNGIYTWQNGDIYLGEWDRGRKDGKGMLTIHLETKDSVVDGFWRDGIYIGKTNLPPYSVNSTRNIDKYSIRKTGESNSIRIRFLRMGGHNADISNVVVGQDSGSKTMYGSQVVLEDLTFPVKCTLRYTTSMKLSTQQISAAIDFTINEQGGWEVSLSN